MATLNTRIKLKYDDLSNWAGKVLLKGEVGFGVVEVLDGIPQVCIKVGDGVHAWGELPEVYGKASDVYAWAKQENLLIENVNGLSNTLTGINEKITALEGAVGTGGTVDKQIEDAIAALDAEDTEVAGQFVVAVPTVDGKAAPARRALAATDIPELTLAKITDAGTAAAADVLEGEMATVDAEAKLVTEAQVVKYVTDATAALAGATHFVGKLEQLPAVEDSENGDIVIVGVKEYIFSAGAWVELGDESIYATKATTIAGVDLENDITKEELLAALNVADGAQVNVLEGVKVNGVDLAIADKKVDVLITEGEGNGEIKVNGAAVKVHGLGTAAFENVEAFDAAGAANTAETNAKAYTNEREIEINKYADQAEADAIAAAKLYADGAFDAKGAAATAETNAKAYADGLAGNYDAKGAAATALTDAKAYTDGREVEIKKYADTAEADAITSANGYTDTKAGELLGSANDDATKETIRGARAAAADAKAVADAAIKEVKAGTGIVVTADENDATKVTVAINEAEEFIFNCGTSAGVGTTAEA